ncbi:hypothetical protein IJV79_04070 [bacterium]|nr:hypothetical protein [bacterium]
MKRLVLSLILLIFAPVCFGSEPPEFIKELQGHLQYTEYEEDYDPKNIYLEPESVHFINIREPQRITSKALDLNEVNFNVVNPVLYKSSALFSQEQSVRPFSANISEKRNNVTFGTEYGSYLYDAEINYTTGVYTKIDKDRFALTMSVRADTGNNYSYYDDRILIAPEIKLTERLSLLEIMQSNVKQTYQKHELVLRYNPRLRNNYNDLFFELGAGQTFREQNYVKSTIRFSTRFNL